MRIAAGVLLIIIAIINLMAGMGLALAGGAAAGMSSVAETAGQQAGLQAQTEEEKQAAVEMQKQIQEGSAAVKSTGGALALYGIFLIVLCGLQIAAAVLLFMSRSKTFILVTAILGILAEVTSIVWFGHLGITNILGIVAGLLALAAAVTLATRPSGRMVEA